VLAVQEFKTSARAGESLRQVLDQLNAFTDGSWHAVFDECPQKDVQHVGVMWNSARVKASDARTLGELNPHGLPCKDALRPGLQVALQWVHRTPLLFSSVHFKSGSQARSFGLRSRTFEALVSAVDWKGSVIVAGDFNTMGCRACAVEMDAMTERRQRAEVLKGKGISLVPAEAGCSLYYRGAPQLLDGFALSADLKAATVTTAGICGDAHCATRRGLEQSQATRALSDHCPLVLEISAPPTQ